MSTRPESVEELEKRLAEEESERLLKVHQISDMAEKLLFRAVQTDYGAQWAELLPEKCFKAAEEHFRCSEVLRREAEDG